MIPFSVLDLVPIVEGGTASAALDGALQLARHAEALGLKRYWVAEHHNMPGIASTATAVLIAHVAAGTRSIRVGAGGVMLPNHAPLVIAEQFGMLAALHPGRIDLGLGRAPGTDAAAVRALRRDPHASERFAEDFEELRGYFGIDAASRRVRAVPAMEVQVPFWVLGSSTYGAQLAAMLGLPFAFAAHFSAEWLVPALTLYRRLFRPSASLQHPYAMVCINLIAADTDTAAQRLFSSHQQAFIRLRRGQPGRLPPPVDDIAQVCTAEDLALAAQVMQGSFVGSPDTLYALLAPFLASMQPDELMAHVMVYDPVARLHSLTLTAQLRERFDATAQSPTDQPRVR
jgi:luciferase family oxidoreductase group 1